MEFSISVLKLISLSNKQLQTVLMEDNLYFAKDDISSLYHFVYERILWVLFIFKNLGSDFFAWLSDFVIDFSSFIIARGFLSCFQWIKWNDTNSLKPNYWQSRNRHLKWWWSSTMFTTNQFHFKGCFASYHLPKEKPHRPLRWTKMIIRQKVLNVRPSCDFFWLPRCFSWCWFLRYFTNWPRLFPTTLLIFCFADWAINAHHY